MSSDLDVAIGRSKRLERRLRQGMGATGKGLHELTSSVERRLPPATVKKLRFVATCRNKLVHDLDVTRLDDRRGFLQACSEIEREIDKIAGPGKRDSWRSTIIVVSVIALFLVAGVSLTLYLLHRSGVGFEWSFG